MSETDGAPGRLMLVATPIGNLGDLSPRAVETLAAAALVACEDTRRTGRLLQRAGVVGATLLRRDMHTEERSAEKVVRRIEAGEVVAVVSDAGMPGISDPGERLVRMVVEAGARLRPGVLGNEASTGDESFADGLLEYPQFTRPAEFRGLEVPEVLRSGDHQQVERWRQAAALSRTLEVRPDLMERRGGLSDDDRALLAEFGFDS